MYREQRDGKRSNRLVSVHGHLQHVVWGCSELLAIARMRRSFAIWAPAERGEVMRRVSLHDAVEAGGSNSMPRRRGRRRHMEVVEP